MFLVLSDYSLREKVSTKYYRNLQLQPQTHQIDKYMASLPSLISWICQNKVILLNN